MNYNGNMVVKNLEHVLKEAIRMGAGDGVTTTKQQLEILELLKKKPDCRADIDFTAPRAPLDTLIALCENGPLDDGDVPSKAQRDELVEHGYAARISVKGRQGFNAATYKGNSAYCEYFDADTLDEARSVRLTQQLLRKSGNKG